MFSSFFPKVRVYGGLPTHPHPVGRDKSGPYNCPFY